MAGTGHAQGEGDGVYVKIRPRNVCAAFIRVPGNVPDPEPAAGFDDWAGWVKAGRKGKRPDVPREGSCGVVGQDRKGAQGGPRQGTAAARREAEGSHLELDRDLRQVTELAGALERGERDSEVLDREPGRVERGRLVVVSAPLRFAREHRAELRDVGAGA